ncbi:MAG: hypothetical protein HF982_11150 [Desulfobacteraceae bacterium]|nr:hypothetical protein [Desulfobacteraceae bacterium]MBC2720122.1 hypothetical protein [Desulfobacteraceae bacterium]
MENEVKQQEQIKLPQEFQSLIAGFFPNTKYFDSRFDLLQVQIDESRRNQEQIKDQLRDFKGDTDKRFEQAKDQLKDFKGDADKRFEQVDKHFEQVDKRFEQVDKRFEQMDKRFEQVDKRFEQVDHRFQRLEDKIDNLIERIDVKVDSGLKENRNLTVRLFTFALSFSLVAVVGMFGKLFGLF